MLNTFHTTLIGVASLLITHFVNAADFQYITPNQRGLCTFDFDNPSGYFAYNGVATENGANGNFQPILGSGSDQHDFLVICKFSFVGRDQRVEQTASYKNTAVVPTIVVPFTDAPVASLVRDSNVECTAVAGTTYDSFFQIQETFALISTTPISPVTTTTTVVVPTSALTTTTTTTTVIQPTETTVTLDTVTSTVATGTKTVLAKPALTTKTITITPWARTVKKVAITYTTTTLSCIPPKTGGRRNGRKHRDLAIARDIFAREENTNIETGTCFGQQNTATPTVVNTELTTSTSTETIVEQALTTTTVVNTIIAPAPTTILNVQATATSTRTFTRYRWTVLPRATVTKTIAITNTVTKVPKTKLKSCVEPTAMPQPVPNAPQCENPTTTTKNGCQKIQCR